ncbi:uroporphyrinogen-III synthase [Virgibacillus ainsalahensis]
MSMSLHGKKILITREEKQAKEFAKKVLQYNGIPVEVPLLKISCMDRDENKQILQGLNNYEWIFFTSSNGVDCFFQLAEKHLIDTKIIRDKKVAVVGHKTEDALKKYGFSANFIPEIYNADVMAYEFLKNFAGAGPVLLVRGNRSREVLPLEFSKFGIPYSSIEVYETCLNYQMSETLNETLKRNDVDFVTFTSPSTVEAFSEMTSLRNFKCVCIGTTTEKRAMEFGFTPIFTPNKEFTIDSMLVCINNYILRGIDENENKSGF